MNVNVTRFLQPLNLLKRPPSWPSWVIMTVGLADTCHHCVPPFPSNGCTPDPGPPFHCNFFTYHSLHILNSMQILSTPPDTGTHMGPGWKHRFNLLPWLPTQTTPQRPSTIPRWILVLIHCSNPTYQAFVHTGTILIFHVYWSVHYHFNCCSCYGEINYFFYFTFALIKMLMMLKKLYLQYIVL